MPKLIALEWDAREARVAVGRTRGKELQVEQAFAIDLSGRVEGEPLPPDEIGQRLAAALSARGVGKAEALVGMGRASTELRLMKLPPCPLEEQPDMVRLQATRQFAGIGDDWPLDFVRLESDDDDGAVIVLAASINPDVMRQVRANCEAADLTARHIVLRPFAAASLYRQHSGRVEGCSMLVDVLTDEADLTVVVDGSVVFMRTIRLPAAAAEARAKSVLGEIRRTIGAAQNQTGGRAVERIVLCGDQSEHETVNSTLAAALAIDIEFFDPFEALSLAPQLAAARPPRPGSFAPLLGMLSSEAAGQRHDIDFLNPRRRPKPQNWRRQYAVAAAGVAVIALLASGFVWMQLADKQRRLAEARATIAKRVKLVEAMQKRSQDVEEVSQFVRGDISWLDELKEISEKLPPANSALITNLVITPRANGDGQVTLEGLVDASATASELERNLQGPRHRVIPKSTDFEDKGELYQWRFHLTRIVSPAAEDEVGRGATADTSETESRPAPAVEKKSSEDTRSAAKPGEARRHE